MVRMGRAARARRRPGSRLRKRRAGIHPPVAGIAPGTAAVQVKQPLTARVEAKEAQYSFTVRAARFRMTANQLVIGHSAIG